MYVHVFVLEQILGLDQGPTQYLETGRQNWLFMKYWGSKVSYPIYKNNQYMQYLYIDIARKICNEHAKIYRKSYKT